MAMWPKTRLGKTRALVLEMSAGQFAAYVRERGCDSLTDRRLRGIEQGEVNPTENERLAIAAALYCKPWELGL